MTKQFEASNGMLIRVGMSWYLERMNPSGTGEWNEIGGLSPNASLIYSALREFFRHERDEELGRWRNPMDPSYFVIKNEYDRVVVVNERSSRWTEVTPKIVADYPDVMVEHQVGARYFAAHPVPMPWHAAKDGEVWVLKTEGVDERWNPTAFTVTDGGSKFVPVEPGYSISHLGRMATAIIDARRIFPEVSDG